MKCIRAHAARHDITCMVLQAPLLTLEGHTDYVRCGATSPASGDLWYKFFLLVLVRTYKACFWPLLAIIWHKILFKQSPYTHTRYCVMLLCWSSTWKHTNLALNSLAHPDAWFLGWGHRATGAYDHTVRLWDFRTSRSVLQFEVSNLTPLWMKCQWGVQMAHL
jgi:WD40 repeat protein